VVVSATPPVIHHEVVAAAARARKDLFTEKPLSATTELALEALEIAGASGIKVGSAPDTFLGSAAQTARQSVDRGDIGAVVAVNIFVPYNRAERRHPNPEFLFQRGAGPLLDIPPYHLTWLVHLLGPIGSVIGLSTKSAPTRRVQMFNGRSTEIPIEVDTHVTAIFEFRSGVIGTFVASFDIWSHRLPAIEIYGSLGSLSVPHPNWYDGPVELQLHDDSDWEVLDPVFEPIQADRYEKVRGLGVNDLIASEGSEPHRSNSELAYHVLEVLEAVQKSSQQQDFIAVTSSPTRPPPVTEELIRSWRS
jgi:predicted dehydrogenase